MQVGSGPIGPLLGWLSALQALMSIGVHDPPSALRQPDVLKAPLDWPTSEITPFVQMNVVETVSVAVPVDPAPNPAAAQLSLPVLLIVHSDPDACAPALSSQAAGGGGGQALWVTPGLGLATNVAHSGLVANSY
jgi:hypothetical protein